MPVNAGAALFSEVEGGGADLIVGREAHAVFGDDALTLPREQASQESITSHCN